MENALIIGLPKSKKLAKQAAEFTGIKYHEPVVKHFADGETWVKVDESVRNKYVYIIQSTSAPANSSIMELLITVDALKRAGAAFINVVMPYYGYARQDRKNSGRQPITSKLVADMLQTAGVTRVMTFDLHAQQIQGFFDIPVDNIKGLNYIAKQLREYDLGDLTVVSPDHGGAARAKEIAQMLGAPIAIVDKERTEANKATANFVLGDVKDRNLLIVDDMVDTAGTLTAGIAMLKELGAKDIYVAATHAVLSGTEEEPMRAIQRMKDAGIKKFFTTNTIEKDYEDDFMHVMDLYKVVGNVILKNERGHSISEYFEQWK